MVPPETGAAADDWAGAAAVEDGDWAGAATEDSGTDADIPGAEADDTGAAAEVSGEDAGRDEGGLAGPVGPAPPVAVGSTEYGSAAAEEFDDG